jgi:hypothetical protein
MARKEFKNMDWSTVAKWMGGTLVHADLNRGEVIVHRSGYFEGETWVASETLVISDNGGEVNVSAIVPRLSHSIPYDQTLRTVGPATLGCWLQQALNGAADKIDYNEDFDAVLA